LNEFKLTVNQIKKVFDRGILIPAFAEKDLLPGTIDSLNQIDSYQKILVLCINARVNASEDALKENQWIIEYLKAYPYEMITVNEYLISFSAQMSIWLIDCSSNPLDRLQIKQGVGYTRHLCALRLFALYEQALLQYPYVWSTDADARFEVDYLDPMPNVKIGIYLMPYLHRPASDQLKLYEISMRYYRLGLAYAKSPYAFATIGSTIVFRLDVYQKVKGFPDRLAGEDFYFLNKAVKISQYQQLKRSPMQLIDRWSERVPFGTAQAVQQMSQTLTDFHFYHPYIFEQLKIWIQILNESKDDTLIEDLRMIVPDYPDLNDLKSLISQKTNPKRTLQRRHEWFDAFRTMKWIHHLRQTKNPSMPWHHALEQASFIPYSQINPLALADYQLELLILDQNF
jgi:hypothetical protein